MNRENHSVEKETTYIKRRYHIEDYVAIQNIPLNGYARILHFIIMPIFSIHIPFLISEISRLSGFFVFYYRLEESSLSALVKKKKKKEEILSIEIFAKLIKAVYAFSPIVFRHVRIPWPYA